MDEEQGQSASWSTTEHKTICFTHKWTVDKFDYYLDSNEADNPIIQSSYFSPSNKEELKFYLTLYPKGKGKDDNDHLAIYLSLYSSEADQTRVKYRVSILNQNKAKYNTLEALRLFSPIKSEPTFGLRKQITNNLNKSEKSGSSNWGWPKFLSHKILKNQINGLLQDNKLTIFCEVEAIVNSVNTVGRNEVNQKVEATVLDDYAILFENRKFSDFVILNTWESKQTTVIRMSYNVHKAILAVRSTVFQEMFEDKETKESKENQHVLKNIASQEAILQMLSFIYTGRVQNLDNLASELLILADKYQLDQLQEMCEKSIIQNMTSENAVQMLVLADKHSAKQLRAKAIEYINSNLAKIIETDNWKSIKDKPELYFELFSKLLVENLKK